MPSWAGTVGLGCADARLRVHIGNRPALAPFDQPDGVMALTNGEIAAIGQACGNGWRKVFSVYAKLVHQLPQSLFEAGQGRQRWQQYRDAQLLQPGSETALLYSPPVAQPAEPCWQILMGRGYGSEVAAQAGIPLTWLDGQFAVSPNHGVILCPYFDYRQLTNARIERLVALMMQGETPRQPS
ncbi:DUF6942 family protein [Ferrimonas marina]|uniref:Uncharacterized protein n=1 Tax=Ferrimonas marina TaxID=299255 RepID=A0A1M5VTB9_9GAMM|nr:hypothetical protein [Ferrimonas marina]SHH78173.1 hypothetical protein SAMN02745129_2958 [Ferrimonas marina]